MDQQARDPRPGDPLTSSRLQSDDSPAAATPLAQHDDVLSPVRALRDGAASSVGGQRVGNSGPLANPITTFADESASDQPE